MRIKRLSEYTDDELVKTAQEGLNIARQNLIELALFIQQQEKLKENPKQMKACQRRADRQGFSKASA